MSTEATQKCYDPPFECAIADLEKELKEQDKADKKSHLAAVKKISDEVAQAEAKYAKDYEGLLVDNQQSTSYEAMRRTKLEAMVSKVDRDRIEELEKCYDAEIEKLKGKWKEERGKLPELQQKYSEAQNAFVDQEAPYRRALKFRAKQDDLDALETQIDKDVEAQNLRAAYFLLINMKPSLDEPAKPDAYSAYLRGKAVTFEKADHAQRVAKTALDFGLGEAQKAKKAYDDAKAKRRENILKQIAEEPFPQPTPPEEAPAAEVEV